MASGKLEASSREPQGNQTLCQLINCIPEVVKIMRLFSFIEPLGASEPWPENRAQGTELSTFAFSYVRFCLLRCVRGRSHLVSSSSVTGRFRPVFCFLVWCIYTPSL